jgi:trans-aconitate methyltransferase
MANSTYHWNAQDYAKNSTNQFQWARELIPKLKLEGKETILVLGCGDGKVTAELANLLPNGKIIGVDNSEKMISLAKNTFRQESFPNLIFQVMDARKLTFQSEFDLAFSNAALHWIVDQEAVLAGVYRSLKRLGRLLFQMAGKGNAKDILSIINELSGIEPWKTFFSNMIFPYGFYNIEEYKTFLYKAGLVPERVELFPKDMKFINIEGLAGWIRTTWLPFTERLPVDLRSKFVETIVDCYLSEHPADDDGTIHVGMMRIEVEAYKP